MHLPTLRELRVLPMSAAVRRWAARRRGDNQLWVITTLLFLDLLRLFQLYFGDSPAAKDDAR